MPVYQASQIHNGQCFVEQGVALVIEQGKFVDFIANELPSDTIQLSGTIMPAFINAHCHLELSFLKNKIPAHSGFVAFAQELNRHRFATTIEEQEQAVFQAIEDCINFGTEAIGDICNSTVSLKAKRSSNLKFLNFIEIFGIRNSAATDVINRMEEVYNAFAPLMPSAYVPHAPYSISDSLWHHFQNQWGVPASMHNQETLIEDEFIRNGSGEFTEWFKQFAEEETFSANNISSLQYALSKMQQQQSMLLVHNTFTSKEDVMFAQDKIANRYWVTCPRANQYIENVLPNNYDMLASLGETVCLGTDSLASNTSLNIWEELYVLHQQKQIPLEQLIKFATYNGAQALGFQSLGYLGKGSTAKIIYASNLKDQESVPELIELSYLC